MRGLWKAVIPPRYNETVGLQHAKVFVFDNSVIVSGANLSQDYFTNRQDRYVLVEDCPKLADFFEGLISNISDFSLQASCHIRRYFLTAQIICRNNFLKLS